MHNWQDSHRLLSLTHLDGRNAAKLTSLRPYFSELAWMKERLKIMVSYLFAVSAHLGEKFPKSYQGRLIKISETFSLPEAEEVVDIEKKVNHDLKALELYLGKHLPKELRSFKQYINFGLGSEDINSIALTRLLGRSREEVIVPAIRECMNRLVTLAEKEKKTAMVARTHAIAAGVTTLGKELSNSLLRLCDEMKVLLSIRFQGKTSGEIGTFHSIRAANPAVNWIKFSDRFLASLGVSSAHASTQIVPYDSVIRYLQSLGRVNTILLDLSKNMWLYVLLGYLRVVKIDNEVGSAGMPHKVNPIYFEGAEGGFEMANGIIETLSRKLMINRLQRDFSDSTLRRNISLVMGLSLLSYQSMIEAFVRLEVDRTRITRDLEEHAEVWIEPIKTLMLHEGVIDAFDVLKQKTRGKSFSEREFLGLIDALSVKKEIKSKMRDLVVNQTGNPYTSSVVDEAVGAVKKLYHS